MGALTKQQIIEAQRRALEGVEGSRDVPIPEWGEGATVTLYPLTAGEAARVEAAEMSGINVTLDASALAKLEEARDEEGKVSDALSAMGGFNLDLGSITEGEAKADQMAVALSLSHGDDKWLPADVAALRPHDVVMRLAREVRKLSGMTKAAERLADSFRGQS